jgi:hypothetical protein
VFTKAQTTTSDTFKEMGRTIESLEREVIASKEEFRKAKKERDDFVKSMND